MLRQKLLHRSFKPDKCKTSLKLVTSRIKLLTNKKEVQLKQMKRDLAQLLKSGQNQTARIRVEHVIREEKIMAAYDLIEIYCELISIRLPVIESQKNCPSDLKEAVTSLIFASPRCADIPELLDIQKHFTAKYGKEFTTAAIELRPECGVSRLLVEKLSATAPDGKTKTKVVSSIAEEHNIKWDPKSFAEKELKPPDDFLNGPSTFEKASVMHAESLNFQTPVNHVQKHETPLSFSRQNPRSSSSANQNLVYSDSESIRISTTRLPDVRPSATQADVSHSFPMADNVSPLANANWKMEFKDATAAAQAAAESAERASMAARAAAELSKQHSGSQKSRIPGSRDENPAYYAPSKYLAEEPHKDSVCDSFPDRIMNLQDEQIEQKENDDSEGTAEAFHWDACGGTQMPSHSAPLQSKEVSTDDDIPDSNVQPVEGYNWKGNESNVEFDSDLGDNFETQNLDYSSEGRLEKKLTIPSESRSKAYSDDHKVFNQCIGNDDSEKPSLEQATNFSDLTQTSSHVDTAAVFYESGSDDDEYRFNMGPKYDESVSNLYFMSEGRKTPVHLLTKTVDWSPKTSMKKSTTQSHTFMERQSSTELFAKSFVNSVDYSEPASSAPVTFDDSDGENSEIEGELRKSNLSGERISESHDEIASPDDDLNSMEVDLINNQQTEPNVESNNAVKDDDSRDHSDSESEKGLNLGMLTGGLRNKGYICPPYVKNSSGHVSKSKKVAGGDSPMPPYVKNSSGDLLPSSQKLAGTYSTIVEQPLYTPTSQSSMNSEVNMNVDNKVSPRMPPTDADSDTDEFAQPQQTLSSRQIPKARKIDKELNTKSNLRYPDIFFESDSDGYEEDLPKQTFPSRTHLGSGISRRTKASSSISYSKTQAASAVFNSSEERKPSTYGVGIQPKPRFENMMQGSSGISRLPVSIFTKAAAPETRPEYTMPGHEESTKSVETEQPYSPWQQTEVSSSKEDAKTSSSGDTSAGEKPTKRASHVHPKLPDYDSLASRLQSLRSNS